MLENEKITSNETEVAEQMNNFLIDVIENLDIEHFDEEPINEMVSLGPIETIIKSYSKHPSILKIKGYVTIEEAFSFKNICSHEFENERKILDPQKTTVHNDIPTKILIETKDISSIYLSKIYNVSNDDLTFPESLKNADVVPIHKKEERTKKENYRPVSLLPVVAK